LIAVAAGNATMVDPRSISNNSKRKADGSLKAEENYLITSTSLIIEHGTHPHNLSESMVTSVVSL
jgi:hypothetical protein